MRIVAVTTFNSSGLAQYGERFVSSFEAMWPKEVELVIYSEGWEKHQLPESRAVVRDLIDASPWLSDFKRSNQYRNETGGFRKDAIRFSHKVAALCDVCWGNPGTEYFIWLDADIFAHSPISMVELMGLVPEGNEWIAWLNRSRSYPECGFYILNGRHPEHRRNMEAFEDMYVRDRLFNLAEWHDSYVLQAVVKERRIVAKSLSGDYAHTGHPFVNGPLGHWFDHLKGARKVEGRSRAVDLKYNRHEPYWRDRK
jgi:hypothetical protein